MHIEGHFVPANLGRVFVSQFGDKQGKTAVLCVPSIAEELNLARAVIAKQCQSLAGANYPCYIMDYFGTGDSEGEFEQASADQWLADIQSVGQWLINSGYQNLILFGVRVGALLIAAHQSKLHESLPIKVQILWKPVTNGKLFVNQFIRIKQANSMMSGSGEKVDWRKEILSGNSTEIAGYQVTKSFIEQLDRLAITPETNWLAPTHWLELASSTVTPATKRLTENVNQINVHTFQCPPFWQVPEIFNIPELSQIGVSLLSEMDV